MPESPDIPISARRRLPRSILNFRYARSRGPGGQNVNKLNTKAMLTVSLDDLADHLPAEAIARLKRQARSHLTEAGLQISSDTSRSRIANRDACIERLVGLIRRALVRPKKRKPTRPTRTSRERRLRNKREQSEKKRRRQNPER